MHIQESEKKKQGNGHFDDSLNSIQYTAAHSTVVALEARSLSCYTSAHVHACCFNRLQYSVLSVPVLYLHSKSFFSGTCFDDAPYRSVVLTVEGTISYISRPEARSTQTKH